MTALPEPSHLRAVNAPVTEPLDGDGLALAYTALERVRAEHGLERLSVVVDDPVLGWQVLVVPRGALASVADRQPGWSAEPPVDEPSTDLELAVALCRTALRADGPLTPGDTVELGLRRLEGVEAVAIAGDVIRVQLGASAPGGIASEALGVVKAHLDRTVVVEVTRAAQPAAPLEEPSPATSTKLEVVAVRTAPESGELEVHLRAGEVRTVGRVSLTRGLVGAAEATLEAWHALPDAPTLRVAWARTVETSADARFVVAVAIEGPPRPIAHGIGAGRNPMEAAALATADALTA